MLLFSAKWRFTLYYYVECFEVKSGHLWAYGKGESDSKLGSHLFILNLIVRSSNLASGPDAGLGWLETSCGTNLFLLLA
jgi:hypothetical protein